MTVLGRTDNRFLVLGALALAAVAVVGLYVVKWDPYFHKALEAASSRSLGEPIAGEAAPRPSLGATLGYAAAYFLAVWKAMVLGLLIGAGVQALLPKGPRAANSGPLVNTTRIASDRPRRKLARYRPQRSQDTRREGLPPVEICAR